MTLIATVAFMPTFRKSLLSDTTALWANLRCVGRVYFYQPSTSFFRFVPQLLGQNRPPSIIHRLGKHTAVLLSKVGPADPTAVLLSKVGPADPIFSLYLGGTGFIMPMVCS
jgi:hypothetical protein